jgi:hypothetical protein
MLKEEPISANPRTLNELPSLTVDLIETEDESWVNPSILKLPPTLTLP